MGAQRHGLIHENFEVQLGEVRGLVKGRPRGVVVARGALHAVAHFFPTNRGLRRQGVDVITARCPTKNVAHGNGGAGFVATFDDGAVGACTTHDEFLGAANGIEGSNGADHRALGLRPQERLALTGGGIDDHIPPADGSVAIGIIHCIINRFNSLPVRFRQLGFPLTNVKAEG